MISIEIRGLTELLVKFERLPQAAESAVAEAVAESTAMVESQAKLNIARMFRNSRRMQEAIGSEVIRSGSATTGIVDASGRISGVVLPYMAIHEYGGQTRAHAIFPVRARALRFVAPGALGFSGRRASDVVFAKRVMHPGSRMPQRSFLRAALAQRRGDIKAVFLAALGRAMRGND